MAIILPFRALRYDPTKVALGQVVTQPYDKITPAMQEKYYRASPHNLVRIILGKADVEATAGDVYSRAAAYFREWRQQGILRQDEEPSLYVYAQRFAVPGAEGVAVERRGVIGLGRIEDYEARVVFRHEQTHTKPKQDRLNLLRATRAHFGQIFMLYSDPAGTVDAAMATKSAPLIEVSDEYGGEHRVWRINDRRTVERVRELMTDRKLIIADGHHRYETALSYRNECRAAAASPQSPFASGEAACEYVMMTLVNMDAEGVVILPTHRVVYGLPGFDKDLFLRSLWGYFEVEQGPAVSDVAGMMRVLRAAGIGVGSRTAIMAVTANESFLLRARADAADSLLAGFSPRQRQLDVVQLHAVLLQEVLGISESDIREQKHILYLRDAAEAVEKVRRGQANVAFLMNPVSMEQVRDIALAGEVLPQKSTDFYPKLLSGLTIYALD